MQRITGGNLLSRNEGFFVKGLLGFVGKMVGGILLEYVEQNGFLEF